MDDLSLVVQSVIESELDDLLLDLVYDVHSSLKGIPDDQLDLPVQNGTKTRQFSLSSTSSANNAIEKQTCTCPHCGQGNIIAIRFAYHLAKCLGVGRRSSRQAKSRIIDHVLTIGATSDDSRSTGDDYLNGDLHSMLPEDAGSCTDSTSSSSNHHRRANQEDQDYHGDFDPDDDDEDDWKPKKKKRRTTPGVHAQQQPSLLNKNKRKKKKEEILPFNDPRTMQVMNELDFHNCIIPLDKLCPRTQHFVIPLISSSTPANDHVDDIFLKSRHVSPTVATRSSSPPPLSSHYFVRSPLNLVEDDPSSTTSIILFQEDNKR